MKSVTLLILLALGLAAIFAPKSIGESVQLPNTPHSQNYLVVDDVDLTITQKSSQNLVAPGSTFTFSLLVKNKSAIPADVIVTDNLPAGLTLTRCAPTGNGVCGAPGNNVNVTFLQLAAGASEVVLLTVAVSASATDGTVINNTASVSSPGLDPDPSNNSSTASVTVAAVPILQKSNGIIAFQSVRTLFNFGEPDGIYTVKPDATDEKLFPGIPTNSGVRNPEWAPDGSRLAFQQRSSINNTLVNEIFVINADGSGLLKLADKVLDINRGLTWSPNGSQIAYIGDGGPQAIHIANADGSGSYQLPGSPSNLSAVDWSPDGTKFVYSNAHELFVINADGTGQTQLTSTQNGTNDNDPRWSPDGRRILFTRSVNNSLIISPGTYVINADGSNLRKLFNIAGLSPYWSPDGLSVVLIDSSEVCTVNLDHTGYKCLTNNNAKDFLEFTPSWQKLPNPNPTPTPTPQPTFSLSGKVTTDILAPFLRIALSGPVNALVQADANGNYEFVNLPAGEYTLTPSSISYNFNPPSRTATITNAGITGLDFVGTFVPGSISGHVKDNNGNPLAGIKIFLGSPGAIGGTGLTDANGFYSFTDLPRSLMYFVTPETFTLYDFVPSQKVIQSLAGDEVVDFVGTKQPTNQIAGRVIEAVTGVPLSEVRVDLSSNVGSASVYTDANGIFSFGERRSNNNYTVTVVNQLALGFEPKIDVCLPFAQIAITNLMSNQFLTFTGTRTNFVKFSVLATTVNEGSGSVQLFVTRHGDFTNPATVNFKTADTAGLQACNVANGKASERCDYGSTTGTLRFAAGEPSKSIVIPIVDDVNVEGNETFTIAISNAGNIQVSTPTTVTVTIADNDTVPATQNPIDGVEPFVTQQYIDFLGRLPDSVGFANWVATLSSCPNGGFGENLNPTCDRVHVSSGFFLSDEFRGRGYWVYRFYEVAFNRKPLYAEFIPDMAQVGGAQSPESELLSKEAYIDAFLHRDEFAFQYNGLSNSEFVNALEQNAEITLSNKADLIAALDGHQKTRGQVLREIVESTAVEDKFFIRAFVAMQYFGYLRRDPDTLGYDNWVTTLTNDPSNFRHMIFGFLFSNEYRGRFGP